MTRFSKPKSQSIVSWKKIHFDASLPHGVRKGKSGKGSAEFLFVCAAEVLTAWSSQENSPHAISEHPAGELWVYAAFVFLHLMA